MKSLERPNEPQVDAAEREVRKLGEETGLRKAPSGQSRGGAGWAGGCRGSRSEAGGGCTEAQAGSPDVAVAVAEAE